MGDRMRLGLIGTGSCGVDMWGVDIVQNHAPYVELVGLCDINPGRARTAKRIMGATCPVFTSLEEMLDSVKPDTLLITTPDYIHPRHIVTGMERGCNIICEKPMTTTAADIDRIMDCQARTGRALHVTYNYRYAPQNAAIWRILRSGEIGKLTSVDFHWYLNTGHGGDYFRRWHRFAKYSGTLWLQKSSHHFDLLNWWIDSDPERVYALGSLDFYGKNGPFHSTHCRNCARSGQCDFYFDITKKERLNSLFVLNEHYDGYLRDGCVFRPDTDIYDKMAATVRYVNGTQLSYSLVTYAPYEGYRVAFNGTKGRLDAWIQESHPTTDASYHRLVLFPNFGKRQYMDIPFSSAGHGGGDGLMKKALFTRSGEDPYHQLACFRDGALASLPGIAARESIATGKTIWIKTLSQIVPHEKRTHARMEL